MYWQPETGPAGAKNQQPAVLQKSRVAGSLGTVGIGGFSSGGTPEINLFSANPIQRNEHRKDKCGGNEHSPG